MQLVVKATADKTKGGYASVPGLWLEEQDEEWHYIRIVIPKKTVVLRVMERIGAAGHQIWVRPGVLGLNRDDLQEAEITCIKRSEFKIRRLFLTPAGLVDVIGLLVLFFGVSITFSFHVGSQFSPVFVFSEECKNLLLWSASCSGILGALFLGWRQVWFVDE